MESRNQDHTMTGKRARSQPLLCSWESCDQEESKGKMVATSTKRERKEGRLRSEARKSRTNEQKVRPRCALSARSSSHRDHPSICLPASPASHPHHPLTITVLGASVAPSSSASLFSLHRNPRARELCCIVHTAVVCSHTIPVL